MKNTYIGNIYIIYLHTRLLNATYNTSMNKITLNRLNAVVRSIFRCVDVAFHNVVRQFRRRQRLINRAFLIWTLPSIRATGKQAAKAM